MQSLIVNIVQNLYPDEHKTPKATAPLDFMPVWDKESRQWGKGTEKQSADEMEQFLSSFAEIHNKQLSGDKVKISPPLKLQKK